MREAILVSLTLASLLTINDARNIDFGIDKRLPGATPEVSQINDALNLASKLRDKRKLLLLMPETSGEEEMIENSEQIEETTRKSQKTKRCKTPFRRNRVSMSIKSRSNDENANSLISNENDIYPEEYPIVGASNLRRVSSSKDRKTVLNVPQSLEETSNVVNSEEYINLLKAIRESQRSTNYDVSDHGPPTLIDNRYVCYCAEKETEPPFTRNDGARASLPKGSLLRKSLDKIDARKNLVGARHKKPILENLSRRLTSRRLPKLHSNRARYSPNSLRKKIKPNVQAARENGEVYMPAVYGKQPEFFLLPAESSDGGKPIKIDVPFAMEDRAFVAAPRASFSGETEENSGEYRHAIEQEPSIVGDKRFEDALETSTVYLRNEIGATTMESEKGSTMEVGERLGLENGEHLGMENGERLKIGNKERSKVENGERLKIENKERSKVENGERLKIENKERSKVENGERSTTARGERLKMENGERSTTENILRSTINYEKTNVQDAQTKPSISKLENTAQNMDPNVKKFEDIDNCIKLFGRKACIVMQTSTEPNVQKDNNYDGLKKLNKNFPMNKVLDEIFNNHETTPYSSSNVQNVRSQVLQQTTQSTNADNKLNKDELKNMSNYSPVSTESSSLITASDKNSRNYTDGVELTPKVGTNVDRSSPTMTSVEENNTEEGKNSTTLGNQPNEDKSDENSKKSNRKINDGYSREVEESKIQSEESDDLVQSVNPNAAKTLKNLENESINGRSAENKPFDYSQIKEVTVAYFTSKAYENETDQPTYFSSSGPSSYDNFYITASGPRNPTFTENQNNGGNVQSDQLDSKKIVGNSRINVENESKSDGVTSTNLLSADKENSEEANAEKNVYVGKSRMSNDRKTSTIGDMKDADFYMNSRNENEGKYDSAEEPRNSLSESAVSSSEVTGQERENKKNTLLKEDDPDNEFTGPVQMEKPNQLQDGVKKNAKPLNFKSRFQSVEEDGETMVLTTDSPMENTSVIEETHSKPDLLNDDVEEDAQPVQFESTFASIEEDEETEVSTTISPVTNTSTVAENNSKTDLLNDNVEKDVKPVTSESTLAKIEEDEETEVSTTISSMENTSTVAENNSKTDLLNDNVEKDVKPVTSESTLANIAEDEETEVSTTISSMENTSAIAENHSKPDLLSEVVKKDIKPAKFESTFASIEEDEETEVSTTMSPMENTSAIAENHSKPDLLKKDVAKTEKPVSVKSTLASLEQNEKGEDSTSVSPMENTSNIGDTQTKSDFQNDDVEKDLKPINFKSRSASVEEDGEPEISTTNSPTENTSKTAKVHSKFPDSLLDTQDFRVAATQRVEHADKITDSSQDSLPFCDNTLLQKSIKTVINDFATNDRSESTEDVDGEIVGTSEDLLPEITEIPNLKGILSLPRVENTIANKVKNRLSRVTGIPRKNFDADWATNVITNNLRHMMSGMATVTTELPPFSVVEREFKNGGWRTHVVTLVPSTENETKDSNHLNRLRESVRDLLREPAVNSQIAKQPVLQNIIVQSVKDGLELENAENAENAENDETQESKIRNILSEELQNAEAETEDIIDTSSKPEILNVTDADIKKIIELTRDVNLLSESADDKSLSWETTTMEDESFMISKDHEVPENEKIGSSYRNAASMEQDSKGKPEVRLGSSMDEEIKLHKNEGTGKIEGSTVKLEPENNEELLHYVFPKDSKELQPSEESESSTASGSLRFTEEAIDPAASREFTGEVKPPGMKKSQKSNVEMSKKHPQEVRINSTTMKAPPPEITASSKVSEKSQAPKNINYSSMNKIETTTASEMEFISGEDRSEKNLTYFGKISVENEKNSTDDLRNLSNSDLYYIGDGVKLPLEIRKLNDGSYGLSISRKLCEHVLNRKCPCCVPTEGAVLHSKKKEIDAKDNGEESDKRIKTRKKKETRRTRRYLADDNSQTFSMPVEAFAKKYNLSLNLEGAEKLQNSAQNGKTWRKNPADVDSAKNLLFLSEVSEDRKSTADMDRWKNIKHLAEIVAEEIRDRKLMKVKNSNSIEQDDRARSNRYRNIEGADLEYQRENPILNKINYVGKKQKEHGQYRYQRNVNVNTNKRLEVVKSVLNWLKSVILSADSVADNR